MKQQNSKLLPSQIIKKILIIAGVLIILSMLITAFAYWRRSGFELTEVETEEVVTDYMYYDLGRLSGEEIIFEEDMHELTDKRIYENDFLQINYPANWLYEDCSYHLDAMCFCPDYVDDCGVMLGGGAMPNTPIVLNWFDYDMAGRVSDISEMFYTFENNQGEIRATISLSNSEYNDEYVEMIESFQFK